MEIILKYFPDLSPTQQNKYQELNKQVVYWNERINLISRKDIEYLPERHILHSLGIAVHARFHKTDTVLDVGTGGGFPGLPLAIMFPDTSFTLIDSIGKKVRAVNEMLRSLELYNVRCLQVRAEDYPGKTKYVVCRAVTELKRFTQWVRHKFPVTKGKADKSGIWYLKGGDLSEELRPYPNASVFKLSNAFSESFFETKKLIWLPRKSLF
ncbi:16S rRNA (guanine(527)-N(7))-methyltransferase RsmG [Bacteroidota bacterium]